MPLTWASGLSWSVVTVPCALVMFNIERELVDQTRTHRFTRLKKDVNLMLR
ncbi:hypothetical protein [Frankia sp. Cas4]|uniref:hypothetical protein n=1 Tax=Frankia sp. Cas4 TaxID=3073927 RepID=UPI002AD2EF0F|nr:hypothetical protein [Frankia sp. Cas4]